MKKILCLTLALLMILAAATACKKDDETNNDNNGTPEYDGAATFGTDGDDDEDIDPVEDEKEAFLTACDEVVYVINAPNGLRLRSTMNFDSETNVKEVIKEGTALKRVAKGTIGDENWSKVVYENVEYYTSSRFLSTEKDGQSEVTPSITIEFTDCDEIVYAAKASNLRSTPDKSDKNNIVKDIAKGTELKRTGVMYEAKDPIDNPDGTLGWSRVELEGKTYYMRNSGLTTEKPAA